MINNSLRRSWRDVLFFLIAVIVIAADQASKTWIRSYPEGAIIFRSPALRIIHGQNTGAVFGTFQGFAPALTFITAIIIIVLLVVVFVYWRRSYLFNNVFAQTAVSLYVGGAVGNLLDRIMFGSVTDFIDFSFYPWAFNVADAAMTTAVIMFIFSLVFIAKPAKENSTPLPR